METGEGGWKEDRSYVQSREVSWRWPRIKSGSEEIGAIERSSLAQFHQMLDHRRGQVFNFLRSRLALPGVHRPVFLFESLTGAFQTPFSPFDPSLSLSLSLFCAGGMKNEVDRVRAGILRNRGRDASRNEATAPESNSNRSSTASVSLFPNLFAISTIFYRAFARQRFRARPKENV